MTRAFAKGVYQPSGSASEFVVTRFVIEATVNLPVIA